MPNVRMIRIISPAGALDPQFTQAAAERLRSWGLAVELAPHACHRVGRYAGTADERVADAVSALTDPRVGLVLCTRGGYGMQQIIDRIDAGVRERGYNGAAVWGFSDITELHQLLASYGALSVHGIMCKPIATLPDDAEPLQAMRRMLNGEALTYELPAHPLNRSGRAEGVLHGGNLAVLCGLSGTPYDICRTIEQEQQRGRQTILFIEDVGEHHYKIDRMMHQLRLSGVFERIAGLLLGQFADCDDDPEMGGTLYETIARIVEPYRFPVLFNLPAGHVEHNMALTLGGLSSVDITNKAGRVTCSALPLGLEPRTP